MQKWLHSQKDVLPCIAKKHYPSLCAAPPRRMNQSLPRAKGYPPSGSALLGVPVAVTPSLNRPLWAGQHPARGSLASPPNLEAAWAGLPPHSRGPLRMLAGAWHPLCPSPLPEDISTHRLGCRGKT